MTLDIDALLDRRRLKRRLFFWRTAALVALVAAAVVLVQTTAGLDGLPFGDRSYVARLNVVGVIVEDTEVLDRLEEVAEDDAAKALVVYIDSPGGTVVGGEALYNAIREVAAEKPVVAVMGTTAASAGYMVALAADTIFAHAGTLTGSIGVILQMAEITELLNKLGIDPIAIKSAPLKAVPSPFEELTPAGRAVTQDLVDSIYAMFVDLVRDRRGLDAETIARVSDGRVFTGRQALANGLIDAIGGEDAARAWLEQEHGVAQDLPARDIDPEEESPWIAGIASALFGKSLFSERLTLDGLLAVWHPDLRS